MKIFIPGKGLHIIYLHRSNACPNGIWKFATRKIKSSTRNTQTENESMNTKATVDFGILKFTNAIQNIEWQNNSFARVFFKPFRLVCILECSILKNNFVLQIVRFCRLFIVSQCVNHSYCVFNGKIHVLHNCPGCMTKNLIKIFDELLFRMFENGMWMSRYFSSAFSMVALHCTQKSHKNVGKKTQKFANWFALLLN